MKIKRCIYYFDITILSLLILLWLSFIIPEIKEWVHGILENKGKNEWIVKEGDKAPDFTIELNDSTRFTLSNNPDKVVLLHFFDENGSYEKNINFVREEIWDYYNSEENFILIGLACGMNKREVEIVKKEMEPQYDIVADKTKRILEKFSKAETDINRYVLIGEDGEILKLTYKDKESKELLREIAKAL
ncbi:MAG: redoxin domain-containing protein [Bacteroidaceae bacterium]|nr:redoxin domain-containing protein [Bacteroidaceae bacterium]